MARWKRKHRRPAVKAHGEGKKEMKIRVSAPATTSWQGHQLKLTHLRNNGGIYWQAECLFGDPRRATQLSCLSWDRSESGIFLRDVAPNGTLRP